jgi:tetratricopeptide (TPR) repeat protein
MDRSLARLALGIAIGSVLCLSLPICEGVAVASPLSAKDDARAKQARQLYKEGQYEEAAKIFSSLSIDYPEKLGFTRNLGACYYHLRRPEPAISNLQEYLKLAQNIDVEDRTEVDGWIAEMEKLRDQPAANPPADSQVAPTKQPAPSVSAETAAILPATQMAAPIPPPLDSSTTLTSTPATPEATTTERPVYKKWWLWTGIGAAVVAGTVTAILLAHGSSASPCNGISPNCVEVK